MSFYWLRARSVGLKQLGRTATHVEIIQLGCDLSASSPSKRQSSLLTLSKMAKASRAENGLSSMSPQPVLLSTSTSTTPSQDQRTLP